MVATALFITASDKLRGEVANASSCWPNVEFEFATELNGEVLASYPSLAILYFHAGAGWSADWRQLLLLADEHASRPAVVAVLDAFDPAEAVGLLHQGVADCLPTPLDFARMAMQIGYEACRDHDRRQDEQGGDAPHVSFQPGTLSTRLPVPYELESSRRSAELAAIHQALAVHNNNRSKAAAALGVSRVTLYKKLHKYGMMGLAQDAG